MCIRDSRWRVPCPRLRRGYSGRGRRLQLVPVPSARPPEARSPGCVCPRSTCLLYTSDAADDLLCVDLGGRRIIKKKKTET